MTAKVYRMLWATCALLALAACSPTGIAMHANEHQPAQPITRNPAPRQGYRIDIRIDNAPGPFAVMKALPQYDVVTPECLPPPNSNPGGVSSAVPTNDFELPLTKTGENTWSTVIYADEMLDADYYGRGVCRWKMIQLQLLMKPAAGGKENELMPRILGEQIMAQQPYTSYFNRIAYTEDFSGPDFGGERSRYDQLPDSQLFSVTFSPMKITP